MPSLACCWPVGWRSRDNAPAHLDGMRTRIQVARRMLAGSKRQPEPNYQRLG